MHKIFTQWFSFFSSVTQALLSDQAISFQIICFVLNDFLCKMTSNLNFLIKFRDIAFLTIFIAWKWWNIIMDSIGNCLVFCEKESIFVTSLWTHEIAKVKGNFRLNTCFHQPSLSKCTEIVDEIRYSIGS